MKDIKNRIAGLVEAGAEAAGFEAGEVVVEHPGVMELGDYATAAALKVESREGKNSREVAEKIIEKIEEDEYVEKVEAAGAGFINFYLSEKFFRESLEAVLGEKDNFGRGKSLLGKKVIVEYTDPNPFKEFHIGHLMSNAIGESLARLTEAGGAEVKRANYQGDVGMHVAKAVWAAREGKGEIVDGTAYAAGNKAYETEEEAKREIREINRKIYERSDEEINRIYDKGREESLRQFEKMYKRLGTKFDYYFFESEAARVGERAVKKNLGTIFEESEGAVVFRGEKRNSSLHTRVFINSEGLPTYEAKELGLAQLKQEKENGCDWWVVVTGNEVNDYFKVVTAAMGEVWPELKGKVKHVSHGMLRLPTGKMSSRTGEVVTAESLIKQVREKIEEKLGEKAGDELWEEQADGVAVGAIKYSILKQSPGKDIVFDLEKSISFEGDSGPYLQYTNARVNSLLEQAEKAGVEPETGGYFEINGIVRRLHRFPEVVGAAIQNNAPNGVVGYLHELSSAFNAYYAENRIVSREENASFRVALAKGVGQVLKNGLEMLGMKAPERM